MTEAEIESHIHAALRAAWFAGREIMDVYRGRVDVQWKDDRSPLTEADLRAHRVITEFLQGRTPHTPILSEEAADIPYDIRRDWSACWLVDPLDGTKEFIKRNDEFTVNIALVDHGQPVAGVVYAPALGQCWFGGEGVGAWRLDVGHAEEMPATWEALVSRAEPLPLKRHTGRLGGSLALQAEPYGPLVVVASRSHRNPKTDAFIEALRVEHPKLELISAGSALKLCLVAEGSADVYPRFAPTMEWDTAAGHAVCAACGISVTRYPEGTPLMYNRENLRNPWFLIDARRA